MMNEPYEVVAMESKADAEVICEWMCPLIQPNGYGAPYPGTRGSKWWKVKGDHPCYYYMPRDLTLDALHEAEARLKIEQWKPYVELLLKWKSLDKVYVEQMFWLLHATAEQKIKALAAVIREVK